MTSFRLSDIYTVNMAARKSVLTICQAGDRRRVAAYGCSGVLSGYSSGSHTGAGAEGIERIAACLEEILPHRGQIMLFGNHGRAGFGNRHFSEIAAIMDRLGFPERLGVVLTAAI